MNKNIENNEECKLMLKKNNRSNYENPKEKIQKEKKLKKFYCIFILSLLFILFIFFLSFFKKGITSSLNDFFDINNINKKNPFIINDTLINELNDFINLCKNSTLLYGIQKSSQEPKISVIIPVYNAEKSIRKTVRSAQNQNMSDIEIILVDDFSQDNTLLVIERLQYEDSRIKLLRNKQNKGTLYTRSIGVLNAKGKYIMSIDNDDLFMKNIFNICYEEAELNNFDIIEFSGYNTYYNNYNLPTSKSNMTINIPLYLQFKEDGLIVRQPELSTFMYKKEKNSENYTFIDGLIWGKLIKRKIYKKALDLVGDIIYSEKIVWCEDRIVNFFLLRVANSFKFIKKDGIIHLVTKNTAGHKLMNEKKNKMFHQEFLYVSMVYNITKNSEEAIFSAVEFKNAWNLYFFGLNEENKNFAINLYHEIASCTNISENIREELAIIVKNKLSKENEIFRYYHQIFE